jgi:mono/diheme cytochrome c family protein
MNAATHEVRIPRGSAPRWAGLTALILLAACGGERRESAAAGTEGAAISDTAAPLNSDTAVVTAPDTARDTARPSSDTAAAVRDTIPAKQAQRPPAVPPKPAPSKPKPARPTRDTAATAEDPGASQDTGTSATAQDTGTTPAAETPSGETQTATAPLRDAYHQAPKDTVDQATYDGWKQFNLNCARCHGEDVLGTTIAPHLTVSLKPDGPINTQEAFVQVVCAGRPEKGMPAWCSLGMNPATINQIYSYVKGRSEGKIGPGRPARKEG